MTAADERAEALITLAQRLTGLLTLDCQAFEAHRPQDVAARADETSHLANLYRHESARIRNDPDSIRTASADRRRTLVQTVEALDAVLARHGRAIQAAKTISEGLVHAIAREVASQRGANSSGYGATGAQASAPASAATAITLNRRA